MGQSLLVGNGAMPAEGDTIHNGKLLVKVIPSSPADALEKAGNTALDAVLIDMNMDTAGMNSAESQMAPMSLAREIRGMSGYESLPLGFIKQAATQQTDRIRTPRGARPCFDGPLQAGSVAGRH